MDGFILKNLYFRSVRFFEIFKDLTCLNLKNHMLCAHKNMKIDSGVVDSILNKRTLPSHHHCQIDQRLVHLKALEQNCSPEELHNLKTFLGKLWNAHFTKTEFRILGVLRLLKNYENWLRSWSWIMFFKHYQSSPAWLILTNVVPRNTSEKAWACILVPFQNLFSTGPNDKLDTAWCL